MSDMPPEIKDAAPGVLGSLVALPFLRGPWPVRLAMVLGGVVLSFYGSRPAAGWFDMQDAQGLVGFLIGLFGMALVAKVYEGIAAFNAGELGVAFKDWVRKRLGV